MPIQGFNIGKEAAIDFVHPAIGVLSFGLATSFETRPIRRRLQSIPITNNGEPVYREIFEGWEGTLEIDRTDSTMDALVQLLEDNYFSGRQETYLMITETITNPDGTIDAYRYKNVVLEPESQGRWSGEEKVSQRMGWVCSRRERV